MPGAGDVMGGEGGGLVPEGGVVPGAGVGGGGGREPADKLSRGQRLCVYQSLAFCFYSCSWTETV